MKRDIFYTQGEGKRLAKKQKRALISWLTLPLLMQHTWLTYNWWENPHYWENRKLLLKLLREGHYQIKNVEGPNRFFHKSIDIQFEGSDTVYNIWLWDNGDLTLGGDHIGLFKTGPIEAHRVNQCWKLLDEATSSVDSNYNRLDV
jgi:hypothetical protein